MPCTASVAVLVKPAATDVGAEGGGVGGAAGIEAGVEATGGACTERLPAVAMGVPSTRYPTSAA